MLCWSGGGANHVPVFFLGMSEGKCGELSTGFSQGDFLTLPPLHHLFQTKDTMIFAVKICPNTFVQVDLKYV